MTRLEGCSFNQTLLAVGALVVLTAACDDSEPKHKPSKSSGGTTSQTATSTPASGAATGGAVGGTGGDATTIPSEQLGGATGVSTTPSSTLPGVGCTSDVECTATGLLCDKTAQKCVQCLEAVDCTDGKVCVSGVCGVPPCRVNADCAASASGKVCEVATGLCVTCATAADCPTPSTSECVAGSCNPVTACVNSLACTSPSAPVCDRNAGRCVECVTKSDCAATGSANSECVASHCRATCTATADCTSGNVCNTASTPTVCVECVAHTDCPASKHCSSNLCVAGGLVSLSCSGKTAKPCVSIPKMIGTQTVDGSGDDFCYIPGFELAFDSTAAKVNLSPDEPASGTRPERATYRIGWSASTIHAYVEVVDPSVNPNNNPADIWNGDSVEFMISTSRDVTGLTSTDANTLHVIANSVIGVTVKASGNSGAHTQITDGTLFKTHATATGYAMELKMPWPGGQTITSGTSIYFDAALNASRIGSSGRVAQALLFQAPTPTPTTCTGTGNDIAPFCDDRMWCPTKFQ
ncbi:MAG TPA: sugar-binding protein [Polyangiaceae bacterium]